jgi:hypothetical protein
LTLEEINNENLMGYVEDHINLRLAANATASVDQLADTLHEVMRLNNNRTRRMRYNGREIEPFTDLARHMSYMHALPQAAEAMRYVLRNENSQPVAPEEENEGSFASTDITDLDEVTPRQSERFVRRSLARNGLEARETLDIEMV